MSAHERTGMPPRLDFKYETLVDARQFERPVNDTLLRITEVEDGLLGRLCGCGKAAVHGYTAMNSKARHPHE